MRPDTLSNASTPSAQTIYPTTGLQQGGTRVLITGTGFEDGAVVRFGDHPATDVQVLPGGTYIFATAPAGNTFAPPVDVTVSNPDGQSSTLAQAFSFTFIITDPFPYMPPPIALLVLPSEGPMSGGTQVKIYGQYFSKSSTVTFGGAPVSGLEFIDGTLLQAVTDEHPAGKVDVTVTNPPDLTTPNPSTTTPDAFTYI
jgi:hypothetical protein